MTNYPFNIDNNITLPGVSGSSQEDMAITALRSAVFAIEVELGITPSGIYPDVRTRLDILEARIQFGISPLIPNDGYVKSPLYIWNVPQSIILSISDGYGAPTEDRLNGSLYMRGDGYANNELYVRRGGAWFPIQTDLFTANCDLAGTYLCQEVVGIRNKPLNVSLQTIGAIEDGYHLTWNNFGTYWEAQTGFIPGHDLAAFSGPYGRTGQTVIGLQGFPLSGVAPTDGYTLVWQASDNRWEPQTRAVIFDGYVSRVNLRSVRAFQSPIDNTKTGIVNFGTSTTGSGGATGDYSIILGGDRNISAGTHSMVGGGFLNNAADGYSLVLHGNANTATLANSTVINGVGNTASGVSSIVINGTSNTASGANSTVINGTTNLAAGGFSSILNGTTNSISVGSTHAAIGFGSTNQITGGALSTFSLILGGSNNTTNTQNVLIGSAASALVQSNYSVVLSGISGSIGTSSDHSVINSGITNAIGNSSGFSFIGTGNSITATGLYATVLNSTTATANGLHSLILNGNTVSVTGSYSTIVNGNNNTISGGIAYATILDGYQHTITGAGSIIGDGYSNNISGLYSSILNGNTNVISGRNSTILNGSANLISTTSAETTILNGTGNSITGSVNAVLSGNSNTVLNSNNTYVLGSLNNIQSTSSKVVGSGNIISSGGTLNRVFGNNNTLGANSVMNNVFGQTNSFGSSTHDNTVIGTGNVVDGYGNSFVAGSNNIVTANFGHVRGQYGKARMFGQEVQSNARFTPSKIGEVQWSRLVLDGYAISGGPIPLQLQDTIPTNITLADGYSYEMNIRVMVVNVSPLVSGGNVNPVVPARFAFDVLAHQESTTTAAGSDGVLLSSATIINVASTAGFLSRGTIFVTTTTGVQTVTYTGVTTTSFTGCASVGTGTMFTGGAVRALVLDNVNQTLYTPNTSDDPTGLVRTVGWSVTISAFGDQLLITVDPENNATHFVRPISTASDRRAVATVEWRELSRV